MSRLKQKIKQAQNDFNESESRLEDLYNKQSKANFKRDRKRLRKRLIKDPMFRATYSMMKGMEKTLYRNLHYQSGGIIGLLEQLEEIKS